MASLKFRDDRGRRGWLLTFYVSTKRYQVWLGIADDSARGERKANGIKYHVEELLDARKAGSRPAPSTEQWAIKLTGRTREVLSEAGLCSPEDKRRYSPKGRQLLAFVENYIADRTDWKSSTKKNSHQAKSWLVKFFGPDRRLDSITKADFAKWQRFMIESGLSTPTANKHAKRFKLFLREAFDDRLIDSNPSVGVRIGDEVNRDKLFFVLPSMSEEILRKLPDTKWKLIFALLRYCGLRRHEVFRLRWTDVDFSKGRLSVRSDKTGLRQCPIFPEVRPYLEQMLQMAERHAYNTNPDRPMEKDSPVIPWARNEESLTILLRREVANILGEKRTWPKICQQLRSTRRTELEEDFPTHVVNEWLGHSGRVAEKHYLQVTEDHWSRASTQEGGLVSIGADAGADNPMESPSTNTAKCPQLTLRDSQGFPDQCPRKDSNGINQTVEKADASTPIEASAQMPAQTFDMNALLRFLEAQFGCSRKFWGTLLESSCSASIELQTAILKHVTALKSSVNRSLATSDELPEHQAGPVDASSGTAPSRFPSS